MSMSNPSWWVSLAVAGVLGLVGCGRGGGKVMGERPGGDPKSVLAVKAGDTPPRVVLEGVMVEKCPVAGCWFKLQDDTGVIKVDTKAAGFVVTEVALQTRVKVVGRVSQEGEETVVTASGLRY